METAKNGLVGLLIAAPLILGACSQAKPIDSDRAAFDALVAHANGGELGVAVLSGTEDQVYACYVDAVPLDEMSLADMSLAIRQLLSGNWKKLPDADMNLVAGRYLVAAYSIAGCQGGSWGPPRPNPLLEQ